MAVSSLQNGSPHSPAARVHNLICRQPPAAEKKDAGYKAFVVDGWNGFHRKERLKTHVGDVGGAHYNAMKKCDALLQRNQHIDVVLHRQSEAAKRAYFTRLNGSIDTARLLLKQGLPFRGHDESKESLNKGNFLEVYDCLADHDPDLKKAVEQMAVVLRYVDKCGIVKERFVGLVHVTETSSSCLKSAIDCLFAKFKLSLKKVRGQGYDGASNMRVV
ncbi:uncharacterized protein LOC110436682 [Sorghum bicolor]|uniref:uncharacterized protein LOC110436682 n=1 Tax=Sorghum bicolor TaxID=4558 RepID=UPI000B425EB8|nr:uncharacterized protein LOC110436682 [Sorghum bicolor]|eukprot:XP_021319823.1 uncharacterized protein LOC110436682 [Sorghum bicolor]